MSPMRAAFVLGTTFLLNLSPCYSGDFWTNDRKVHAGISLVLSSVSYVGLRTNKVDRWDSFITSFVIGASVGALKEITDRPMDEMDLSANLIGALSGSLLFISFDW